MRAPLSGPVPLSVQKRAQQLLRQWRSEGIVRARRVIEVVDGVALEFVGEPHKPGPRNTKPHIGITVYPAVMGEVFTLPEVTIYGSVTGWGEDEQRTILAVPGLEQNTTPEFRRALCAMCDRLGCTASNMATCMSFETAGTFDPAKPNAAGSTGTGLIQFMAYTAAALGTSIEALAKMTAVEQLEYVERYFQPYKRALGTLEGCYLSIFYPRARGMAANAVVGEIGSLFYKQNKGLDRDRDGDIEVREICATIRAVEARANGRRIPVG